MRATCLAYLTLIELIILIMLVEEYKLWSSLLCSFLQPPVISSPFDSNILLSTLFSKALSLFFKEESVFWRSPCSLCIHLRLQFKLLKHLTYFYETWYKVFVIRGHTNGVRSNFLKWEG
jgi:hypothetical protein